ncbi:hypothetical protein Tco_0180930 [Tanacetum coccineum]
MHLMVHPERNRVHQTNDKISMDANKKFALEHGDTKIKLACKFQIGCTQRRSRRPVVLNNKDSNERRCQLLIKQMSDLDKTTFKELMKTNILDTRLEPRSDKESMEVEITNDEEARFLSRNSFDTLTDHLQEVMVESLPTMVDTHIKEQVKKQVPEQVQNQVPVYVAEGLILERQKTKEEMERMIAKAILQERRNIQAEISSQIQNAIDNHIPSQVDASLQQQDIVIWLALQMKFENLHVAQTTCRPSAVRPRDQDDPHDDAHPEGENSAKRQKTSEYKAYVSGESSFGQVNEEE